MAFRIVPSPPGPRHRALATGIAALPQSMRGFGHIKMANVKKAKAREADLLAGFKDPKKAAVAAE